MISILLKVELTALFCYTQSVTYTLLSCYARLQNTICVTWYSTSL